MVRRCCFYDWRVSFGRILFLLCIKTRRFLFFHRLLWSSIRRVDSYLNILDFFTIFTHDFYLILAILWVICLVAIKETAWNQATFHSDVVDIVTIGWLVFGVLGFGSLVDPRGLEKVDSLSFDGFGLIKRGIGHNFPSFLHKVLPLFFLIRLFLSFLVKDTMFSPLHAFKLEFIISYPINPS